MTKVKNINVAIDTGSLKLMLDRIGKLESRIIELETKLASVQSQSTVNTAAINAQAYGEHKYRGLPFGGFPSADLVEGHIPGRP